MPATLTENRPMTWQELRELCEQARKWPQFKLLESHERKPIQQAFYERRVTAEALKIIRRLVTMRHQEFASIIRHPLFRDLQSARPNFAQVIIAGYHGSLDVHAQLEAIDYWDAFLEVRRPKPAVTIHKRKRQTEKHLADKAKSSGKKK